MADYNVIKTGKKTNWRDREGNLIEADVYKYTKTWIQTHPMNKVELLEEKANLEAQLLEINILLAEVAKLGG